MSDSLTTLIGKVQNILGDASATFFTTAICTAAIRQALAEFNRHVPQHAAVTITGVNDRHEYELTATDNDPSATQVLDVLRRGDNNNELDISLTYDDYIEDERVWFRLRTPITTSEFLIVRYTKDHMINGLDGQVQSTLLTYHDQIIVDGGAYHALMIRATARIEAVNVSDDPPGDYSEAALHFRNAFNLGLENAQRRRAPVGEPDTRAWNDKYHYWNQ